MRAGDLDYALARVAARFGERPGEAAWRSLGLIRGLPALIDAARTSAFRHWTTGIGVDATAHEIEAALRSNWRAQVDDVQLWMPVEWQAAVDWAGRLVDLPVAQHLARGGLAAAWMRDDPVYREWCEGAAGRRPPGTFTPLAAAWSDPEAMLRLWRDEWRRRLPTAARSSRASWDEFARVLLRHRAGLAERSAGDGVAPRRALAARLTFLYRRAISEPVAVFIFLALSALDVERLRGELVRRAIFVRSGLVA